jgi:hypothetical protein
MLCWLLGVISTAFTYNEAMCCKWMDTRFPCLLYAKVASDIFSWASFSTCYDRLHRHRVCGADRTAYTCWNGLGNDFVEAMPGRSEQMALG